MGNIIYSPGSGWTSGTLGSGNAVGNIYFPAVGIYIVTFCANFNASTNASSAFVRFSIFSGSFTIAGSTVTSGLLPIEFNGGQINDGVTTNISFGISGSFITTVNSANSNIQVVPGWSSATNVTCVQGYSNIQAMRIA